MLPSKTGKNTAVYDKPCSIDFGSLYFLLHKLILLSPSSPLSLPPPSLPPSLRRLVEQCPPCARWFALYQTVSLSSTTTK